MTVTRKPKLTKEDKDNVASWARDAVKLQDEIEDLIQQIKVKKVKLNAVQPPRCSEMLGFKIFTVSRIFKMNGYKNRVLSIPDLNKILQEYKDKNGISGDAA